MSKDAWEARPSFSNQNNDDQKGNLSARSNILGIPADLYRRIHKTLRECSAFQSAQNLEPIFIDQRLARYSNDVSSGYNVDARTRIVFESLYNKYDAAHQNGFVSFLEVLRDHTPVENFLHQHLQTLIDELKGLLGSVEVAPTFESGEPGIPPTLYMKLLHGLEGHPAFSSNQNLKDLFDVTPLRPWRATIRDNVRNEQERIEFLITDIFRTYNTAGQNALALFLHVLSEHESSDPELKPALVDLAQEVERTLNNPLC